AAFIFGVFSLVMGGGIAHASTFAGEACWQLVPFPDLIHVALDTDGSFISIHGRWRSGSSYSIAIAGNISADPVHGGLDFYFSGADYVDPAVPFSWQFHAKTPGTGPTPLNGTWFFKRDDGFTNSGTFVFLGACPIVSDEGSDPSAND